MTASEIETLATQIAEPGSDLAFMKALISYLPKRDLELVIGRAAELSKASSETESDALS